MKVLGCVGYLIPMGKICWIVKLEKFTVWNAWYVHLSFVKNKGVILGPKANTLEKHIRKKGYPRRVALGKKKGDVNKKCNHVKNEVAYCKKIASQLLKKFKEG